MATNKTEAGHAEEARRLAALSKSEFARLIGVTPARVGHWVRDGMPVTATGRVDIAEGQRWVSENVDPSRRETWQRMLSPSPARGEREVAEAEIARLKAGKLAGSLIGLRATLRVVEGRARYERDAWIGWVNRAAPLIASAAGADMALIVAVLDHEVRAQLAALAAQPLELPE
jgi:hypothetical protein